MPHDLRETHGGSKGQKKEERPQSLIMTPPNPSVKGTIYFSKKGTGGG